MLQKFIIFSFLIVAAYASGEFSILSSPKSLAFKGQDPLQGQYVADVLSAAMGYDVVGDAQWSGLVVNDPFYLAKGIIAVHVDGVNHLTLPANAKTYELEGSSSVDSLSAFSADLESRNVAVCDINLNDFEDGVVNYRSCFGNADLDNIEKTKYLNPASIAEDKQFLQTIALINAASERLSDMEKASNFIAFRLSLESLAKLHGEKSDALTEASKLLSSAIGALNTAAQKSSHNEALVVVVADKASGQRSKRQAAPAADPTDLNLAEYYSEDYPVIFNIILWFMVVFFLSLLAICYAIGAMDPGRDSIIYRMTSTRMKKDN